MREMSVAEQRYKAILAVIADGRTVSEVASDWGVCRRTMHRWLAHYEAEGLELSDRSRQPAYCPHQMPATVEVMVLVHVRTCKCVFNSGFGSHRMTRVPRSAPAFGPNGPFNPAQEAFRYRHIKRSGTCGDRLPDCCRGPSKDGGPIRVGARGRHAGKGMQPLSNPLALFLLRRHRERFAT
ncbi:MAG: helix-turn-helix domain-containing protein [Chloroflexi bacterium]|nr:MAG: helix-turn-helix domain-containing protein [Chloroflexota bacterium]